MLQVPPTAAPPGTGKGGKGGKGKGAKGKGKGNGASPRLLRDAMKGQAENCFAGSDVQRIQPPLSSRGDSSEFHLDCKTVPGDQVHRIFARNAVAS